MSEQPKSDKNPMPLQGEGDYEAARRYRAAQEAFAKSGKVEGAAREAEAALDGPEREKLEEAREESARGEPRKGRPPA